MARTKRNRSTIPDGWTVRDDGYPYYHGKDRWGRAGDVEMPKYRRSLYRCEQTWARRMDNQKYRNKTKHLVRMGKWDDIIPQTRTSGWLSW